MTTLFHPADATGRIAVHQGWTADGAYLGVGTRRRSIAAFGLRNTGTAQTGFVMDDNAIMNTADLDVLILFRLHETGQINDLIGKYNETSNRREWRLRTNASDNFAATFSSDGSTTTTPSFGAVTVVADVDYAFRMTYNDAGNDVDWAQYDYDQVVNIVDQGLSASATMAAVDALTPLATEQDVTAITLHNDTAKLAVCGHTSGASDDALGGTNVDGTIRYAQVVFDGGTAVFDPTRDAYIGAESFTDGDSGLGWARQTTAAQSDWVTRTGLNATMAAGDFLRLNHIPDFDSTGDAWTCAVVFTPRSGTATGGRVVSSESSSVNNNGFCIRRATADTLYDVIVGGSVTTTNTVDQTVVVDTEYLIAAVIDDGNLWCYLSGAGFGTVRDISGIGTMTHDELVIGARAFNKGLGWAGDVRQAWVIGRAMSEAELDHLAVSAGV